MWLGRGHLSRWHLLTRINISSSTTRVWLSHFHSRVYLLLMPQNIVKGSESKYSENSKRRILHRLWTGCMAMLKWWKSKEIRVKECHSDCRICMEKERNNQKTSNSQNSTGILSWSSHEGQRLLQSRLKKRDRMKRGVCSGTGHEPRNDSILRPWK